MEINGVDLALAALMVAFGYRGYRLGLIRILLNITGTLIAFGLAAALVSLLLPLLSAALGSVVDLPVALVRAALVLPLSLVLRRLIGLALREVQAVVVLLVRGVPPLALLDRALGVLPLAVLGAAIGMLALAGVLLLPDQAPLRDDAARSWTARTLLHDPLALLREGWSLVERALTRPLGVQGYAMLAGATGLAVAAVGARQLRPAAREAAWREAPTVRRSRPEGTVRRMTQAPAVGGAQATGELVFRALCGVGIGMLLAAGLFLIAGFRLS